MPTRPSRTVLLTGFEPFGGDDSNPSEEAVLRLSGSRIRGRRVIAAVLPCVFRDSLAELRRLIRTHDPEVVICVGEAGGRRGITLERVAINVDDARIEDNAGQQPIDEPIVASGPVAYWSTLPIKAIHEELRNAGIESGVSQSAGTFVCNHVFYGLMRTLARRAGTRGGFVHVPYSTAQARRKRGARRPPALSIPRIAAGLEIVIRTTLSVRGDRRSGAGALH